MRNNVIYSIARRAGFGGLLALALTATLAAQVDRGIIVGAVTDPSGAAVPGAKVAVTNRATGVNVTSPTNADGQYQVINLTPGEYRVSASASGFTTAVVEDVPIHVQSRAAVNFQLKVGQVQQQVVVTNAEPLLQTQSADVGGVVGSKQINDLPLNGRRYADLALLEPGVSKLPNAETANAAPDRFNVDGNLETQNYFSLDGVDNNSGSTNLQEGSVQVVQPPPDALQEFRVQTRTYTAEFGTSAGAVINTSLKSGGNQFHGDLWEYLRNNKLDANSFFNNAGGLPNGHFEQNQFGGTIGGPIVRGRTFFFADAQGLRSSQATTVKTTVPTALMQQGNFTELPFALNDSSAVGQTGCVIGNIVQPNCLDPVGAKLLALFPSPNIPGLPSGPGSWTGNNNYQFQTAVPNHTNSTDFRIDHTLNASSQIYGRYSYYHVNRQDPAWTTNPIAGNGNFATQYNIHGQSLALGWTDVLSPNVVNQFHFGFSREYAHSDPIGLKLGKSLASTYGLRGIPDGPNSAGIPPINIGGLQRLGSSPWRPQFQVAQVWQGLDSLSILHGTHSFQLGYEYHRTGDNFLDIEAPQSQLFANGSFTNQNGFGAADFLLGNIDGVQFVTPLVVHNYMPGHAVYGQDTWRATSNLTLIYGLRYELFAPVLNRQNQTANFTPANGGGLLTASNGSWYNRALIHPDFKNFAPRFGVSYHAFRSVVFRGGYGIFYQHAQRIGSEAITQLNPPYLVNTNSFQQFGSSTPVFQLRNGLPASIVNSTSYSLPQLQIRAQDPNQRTSYVEQASFGPEIELGHDMALDLTYVGNWGRKMNRLRDANQGVVTGTDGSGNPVITFPYANLNNPISAASGAGAHAFLELATNDGSTSYNAFQASLRRNFTSNFGYAVSYTWSHAFSNYVDNLTGGAFPQNAYAYNLEKSNSPFDVRHRLVANMIYALPIGPGRKLLNQGSLASNLLGGWQTNLIVTLQTGTPFDVNGPDQSLTDPNGAVDPRPNCIGNPFSGASSNAHQALVGGNGFYINPAAFAQPAVGTFGNCAPRLIHGPGLQNWDFSLFKNFSVTERQRVELRGEFFNAFNHPNFANPSAFYFTGVQGFGQISNTITDPRQIQVALKYYF